ncbi:UNVERIFIED_CONTAM: hypothetical protein NCL1_25390 [Trichonephila clavipes]
MLPRMHILTNLPEHYKYIQPSYTTVYIPTSVNLINFFYTNVLLSSHWMMSSQLRFTFSLSDDDKRRPLSFVIVMLWVFPELLSIAETFKIPLASISNVTSIWGTPLGAGGIPESWNLPSRWLSFVIARSPSYTWISTPG